MHRIFSGKEMDKDKNKNREEIEAEAFTQMRKAKAAIDPGVLAKVRAAIQNSPMANKLMGNVALKEEEQGQKIISSEQAAKTPAPTPKAVSTALSQKPSIDEGQKPQDKKPEMSAQQLAKKEKALLAAKKAHEGVKESEPVDRAKMLDIVAKMLELNPHKEGLKDGIKDMLKRK